MSLEDPDFPFMRRKDALSRAFAYISAPLDPRLWTAFWLLGLALHIWAGIGFFFYYGFIFDACVGFVLPVVASIWFATLGIVHGQWLYSSCCMAYAGAFVALLASAFSFAQRAKENP